MSDRPTLAQLKTAKWVNRLLFNRHGDLVLKGGTVSAMTLLDELIRATETLHAIRVTEEQTRTEPEHRWPAGVAIRHVGTLLDNHPPLSPGDESEPADPGQRMEGTAVLPDLPRTHAALAEADQVLASLGLARAALARDAIALAWQELRGWLDNEEPRDGE